MAMASSASRTWHIYCHTAPNGKRYIGQTCQEPEKRWANGYGYRGQPHFKRAIDKYGWDNFKHVVLCSVSCKEYADFLEQWFIEKYDTFNPEYGYNHTKGGGGNYGFHLTEENIEKLRQAVTNREWTEEQREKISSTLKEGYASGRIVKAPMTEDARKKMSADRTGEGNPMYGKHHTPEALEKIKAAHTGSKRSAETCKRISESRYKSNLIKRCPVYQFTMSGVLVGSFASLKEANEQTGFAATNISNCCRGKYKQAYGYIWCYQDRPETFPSPVEGLSL